jgi:hypothetical protein
MSQHIPKAEAQRRAKAVGQAHTVKEYEIHAGIVANNPGMSSERAWHITNSMAPKSRGRRPKS